MTIGNVIACVNYIGHLQIRYSESKMKEKKLSFLCVRTIKDG